MITCSILNDVSMT